MCSYGKLNHWLGAQAAAENRQSIYPDIDFCKNPGAICTDRRAPELRWVTGMLQWVLTVQRSRGSNYFLTLKAYVEGGDYTDDSFISMVNAMLGGSPDDISKRTNTFFNALRAFNLISAEGDYTGTPVLSFCGVDYNDAGIKCTPCETNMDCSGMDLCHVNVTACDFAVEDDDGTFAGESTNATAALVPGVGERPANVSTGDTAVAGADTAVASADTTVAGAADDPTAQDSNTTNTGAETPIIAMTLPISSSMNFCGETWADALTKCAKRCECCL